MDIIGHKSIVHYFLSAYQASQLAQAYLFVGPEKVGKKHVATWLRTLLMCVNSDQEACGECPSCTALEKLLHPDSYTVQPVEGKHQIAIEQIRELQKGLQRAPSISSSTIAIIDNAHEMSLAASNSLLKTLEEPTETSILFLISHQPDYLPATIRSRCQIIEFSRVRDVDEKVANDPFWQQANGLPGRYLSIKESGSDISAEKENFVVLLHLSKGERLVKVSQWFGATSKKHSGKAGSGSGSAGKETKDEWLTRLELWKGVLREAIMIQLGIEQGKDINLHNLKLSLPEVVNAIDCISLIKKRILQNGNIRTQIEYFVLTAV